VRVPDWVFALRRLPGLLSLIARLLVLLVLVAPLVCAAPASADGGVTWDAPVLLSESGAMVQDSTITADLAGGVHVFWTHMARSSEPASLLFYSFLLPGRTWSVPTDLFAGADYDTHANPSAVCDGSNRLHLIWTTTQALYYSSALAIGEQDPRLWQKPVAVVWADALASADLVVAPDGMIHVVYSRAREDTGVMYVQSSDHGQNWSTPLPLSTPLPNDRLAADAVTIAIDSEETLHVAWHESHAPDFLARQILYARSTDGGRTWPAPQPLSPLAESGVWNALPNLVIDGEDALRLIWACGNPVARCYRCSLDHGVTWSSEVTPLFATLIGSSGRDAVAVDSHGDIYWAGSLRYPQAFYSAVLSDMPTRARPQVVVSEMELAGLAWAHFPSMVASGGNQLHLVLVESDGGPLWYLHGQTESAPLEPPGQGTDADATVQPTLTTTATPTPVPTPVPGPVIGAASETPGVLRPLTIGLGSAAFFVAVGVVLGSRRRR